MSKLSTYTLAIAVCLGTTAMLDNSQKPAPASLGAEQRLDLDGAFRDGLYLGKLSADAGAPARPPIGRWSSDRDRAAFVTGFRRAYSESISALEP